MEGYVTLLGTLINKYEYKFGEDNQPDKDTLIMLALAEILLKLKEDFPNAR